MQRLGRILREGTFSTRPEDLICYGFDASRIEAMPAAVVWPEGTEEVVRVAEFAYENDIPLVPRGAGTSTTGGAVPCRGGIVLSLERMDRILEVDTDNLTVLVEPGVVNGRLQRELRLKGYFYPPDPASLDFCTLGGNVAENAGGPRAVKYGVTGNYVMAVEAVLADGRVIQTGVRTTKGVVGYDLKSLLVGSEGTLAVMTKIRLRILPEPRSIVTLLASFDDLRASGDVVSEIISSKVIPRSLEFMDRAAIQAAESYNPCGLKDAEALLIIELDGDVKTVQKESGEVVRICNSHGAEVTVAEDDAARNNLWQCRRSLAPALYRMAPTKISEDIVVPRTAVPDMLVILRGLSEESGIRIVSFGHAGDGNIHVNIMVDERDEVQYRRGLSLVERIFAETLRLGGTISGEHGVGLTKAEYIEMEIMPPEMDIMRGIKKFFDHKNILNPGKVFP